ncbi:GDSL-like Lipase/Acylhydrolase [Planctomycetes bacterium Pla163]|uniref:GDSL-like Lipase/Acylhydrolase n=1 Tax=Rohdeia mirabilis TaxID=2528008 RepID=A0A518D3C7_9BACT|nr:GDSL-like Lipase/Acylhydrolase [Planctomycetes bacterium Pla163]
MSSRPKKKRSLALRLTLASASALVALGLSLFGIEAYLAANDPDPAVLMRNADPGRWAGLVHRPSAIEGLSYELVPGFEGRFAGFQIRVNDDGLRGANVEREPDPKRLRIAVIGDSTTFGYGVFNTQTYSHVLQQALNARRTGWHYEVLNFGTSGYNTLDEALVLEEKVLAYEPDLVVVGYNLNDPDAERRQPLNRFFDPQTWWENTHLYQRLSFRAFKGRLARYSDVLEYFHDPEGPNWQVVVEGFARIGTALEGAGLPGLVVIFPTAMSMKDYVYEDLHAQVAAEAEKNDLAVLDLAPVFAAEEDAVPGGLSLADLHPNEEGHRVAAEAIAAWILDRHEQLFDGRSARPKAERRGGQQQR